MIIRNLPVISRWAIFGVLLLFAIQIVVSVIFSTLGQSIGDFEEKASSIELENQKIQQEIAKEESILNLQEQAAEMGFKERSVIYLPYGQKN